MTDLDSNIVLLDSFGTLNRNLVVRPVPLFHAEVVVLDVEFKVGQDELINRFPGPRENKQGMTKERSVLLAGQISRESNPREEGSSSSKGGGGEKERGERRTSSRIFFQMILVISSPSSSTTGLATLILARACWYASEVANSVLVGFCGGLGG